MSSVTYLVTIFCLGFKNAIFSPRHNKHLTGVVVHTFGTISGPFVTSQSGNTASLGPSNYAGCILVTKAGGLDWRWWCLCFACNDRYVSPVSCPRVSQCVENKMDKHNLARVFGPTLVGHAVPDPDPMTILNDTNRQPRVHRAKPRATWSWL